MQLDDTNFMYGDKNYNFLRKNPLMAKNKLFRKVLHKFLNLNKANQPRMFNLIFFLNTIEDILSKHQISN